MSGRIWYTADPQIRHLRTAQNRGFATVEEHDEVILRRFNQCVRPTDRVYILGDFAMNWDHGCEEILARMNGEKILIIGNHEVMFGQHRDAWKHLPQWIGPGKFASIVAHARRVVGNREFLMSHFPYEGDGDYSKRDRHTQWRLRYEGKWLLHGHIHSVKRYFPFPDRDCFFCGLVVGKGCLCNGPLPVRQLHVGCDAWGLCPVEEPVLLRMMREQETREKEENRVFEQKLAGLLVDGRVGSGDGRAGGGGGSGDVGKDRDVA